jgi:hypothetical protein
MPPSQQNGQQPSAGRATGASGGAYGKFPCRNAWKEGHPREYHMVDSADSLCASCQVFTAPSLCLTLADHFISANLEHNAERKFFSIQTLEVFSIGR